MAVNSMVSEKVCPACSAVRLPMNDNTAVRSLLVWLVINPTNDNAAVLAARMVFLVKGLMLTVNSKEVVAAAALVGTELNVRKRRSGFLLWAVTNLAFVARNAQLGEWPQAVLFAAYLAMSVRGWFAWKEPSHA